MRAVNLLPPELRTASGRARSALKPTDDAPGGAGPYFVLGALALSLLAMVAYVLAANTVTERRAELARVTAEHEAAASRAAALKPYGDFQDMALRRTQTVTSLAALRFDWEQSLRDVSRALPDTVTLSALDGSISKDSGAASSPMRDAIPSPAITLKGCSRNQSAVASMLSRLRAVRGATRVTLSKSERVGTAGAVGAEAGPCGEGSRPQFEVVVFFQRSGAGAGAVTAAATMATAAPAPGSTATPAPGAAATPAPGATATPAPGAAASTAPGAPAPATAMPMPAGTSTP
ncbi:MAG: hypothetical protein AVDCRST_MAG38-488 [uncultured Solirubrobacteraceae bacterium]|uniref:Type IV pilus biogenesis protein PilN n=1 Tax=uncultured Solirubrobacteraceae bacterium TaxID=1162706 RepID=A0A6J4R4F1_9ACTN|nr:MAG: hypothetical protein AVDCRST_MAG38-488 [uncultured Solirubrobacteraceae bacterium]